MTRPVIDLRRRPELDHSPLGQGRGDPAEQQRLERFGCRINEDRAGLLENRRQLLAQFLAQLVVEIGQRLVEQHQIGVS